LTWHRLRIKKTSPRRVKDGKKQDMSGESGNVLGFGFNYRTTVAVGVQKPHLQWVDLGS